jgi:uncharacterized surface protein with fasciclin (FAS1) repeats
MLTKYIYEASCELQNLVHRMKIKNIIALLSALSISFGTTVSNAAGHENPSIVETAQAAGTFNTLLAAAEAAGIVDWIDNAVPKTLFAPTDDAFAALPEGTVESLLLPENKEQLTQILRYHFVDGEVRSTDLANGYVETLARAGLKITLGSGVALNDSTFVTTADIEAKNGVIHIIDAVLLPPSDSIVDIAVATPDLSTLVAALQAANLVDAVAAGRPLTVLAPTNAAFAALPEGVLDSLLLPENVDQLTDILLYHVAPRSVYSNNLANGPIGMLNGDAVTVDVSGPSFDFNGGSASPALVDIVANNGVVHVIDTVLLPRSTTLVDLVVGDPQFSTLLAAVQAAGLADTLATIQGATVFAPTNDAFAALPAGLLDFLLLPENAEMLKNVILYHVLPQTVYAGTLRTDVYPTAAGPILGVDTSSGVVINGGPTVVAADVLAGNGVVHAVDQVILTPLNIPGVLTADPKYSTLVAAVTAAGLVDTLSGAGPFTLFAPTNDAFAKLPAGTLDALLAEPGLATLTAILTAHVVSGSATSGQALQGPVTTLQGKVLNVHRDHGALEVGDGEAFITNGDIPAWNGIIHEIDTVLMP